MIAETFLPLAIAFFLCVGLLFTFVAAIGLLKLNDGMTRLHAPTKAGTLGIGSFLIASVLHSFLMGEPSMHELLVIGFLFVTAPVTANFIAKVNLHTRSCDMPDAPSVDTTWSTLDTPEVDKVIASNE
ncbi:monovalent cation/H(+) antiporter subunit G [Nereida sp. MMG025]|uniref:monovalent cation/H(+) antiporter subunit G n=1 Tax=Nereida sp. MMG025 TaxID=2909981 RepID=UPI001F00C2D4|nr:monovalent cation/H(+) antiporter subunit G [Nereida sp. MMG025]MCF6443672.1 monovalent cation/H(+) antiporter subunit G [Nereida sp. MMG025]